MTLITESNAYQPLLQQLGRQIEANIKLKNDFAAAEQQLQQQLKELEEQTAAIQAKLTKAQTKANYADTLLVELSKLQDSYARSSESFRGLSEQHEKLISEHAQVQDELKKRNIELEQGREEAKTLAKQLEQGREGTETLTKQLAELEATHASSKAALQTLTKQHDQMIAAHAQVQEELKQRNQELEQVQDELKQRNQELEQGQEELKQCNSKLAQKQKEADALNKQLVILKDVSEKKLHRYELIHQRQAEEIALLTKDFLAAKLANEELKERFRQSASELEAQIGESAVKLEHSEQQLRESNAKLEHAEQSHQQLVRSLHRQLNHSTESVSQAELKKTQQAQEIAQLTTLLLETEQRLRRSSITGTLERPANGQNNLKADLQLLKKSSLFAADWYLKAYPDVAKAGVNPAEHYLRHGGFENRNPSLYFDSGAYLQRYPDVRQSGANPLIHYLLDGERQGCEAIPVQERQGG